MSSLVNVSQASSPGSQSQLRRLRDVLGRWLEFQLNSFFDLSIGGARRRNIRLAGVLALLGVVAVGVQVWLTSRGILGSTNESSLTTLPTLVAIHGLRIAIVTAIAAAIGLRAAGYFLTEVFELRDPQIAWKFLRRAASGGTGEVLRLREGKIAEGDGESPILLIGGPGRVQTDSDTAALFERPDGTPHAVVPQSSTARAAGSSGSGELLGVFERLREPVIDLRDQYIGTSAGEPITVVGRSLDGMPISIVDVHGVFSVRRDPNAAKAGRFERAAGAVRPQDIENLIYRQTVPVLSGEEYASGIPPDWTAAMRSLVRESLREFMSQNRLADYLSGTGALEIELSEFREDTILAWSLQVARDLPGVASSTAASASGLRPRTELSAKFKKYGSEFSTRAQQSGLELHWIGVGTWKIPEANKGAVVDDKHLQAWRLNRENAGRSDPKALESVSAEAVLEGKLRLLREVPISSHQRNQQRYSEKFALAECLLQDFLGQLGDALDVYYRNDIYSGEVEALEHSARKIEDLLGLQQLDAVLGPGFTSRVRLRTAPSTQEPTPPAPASRTEAELYQVLLAKLDGSYRIAEAMIDNEARRHADLNREQLITRIVQRFDRHGR